VRVGIGALLGVVGGPATYARELVAALAAGGGHEYVVFTDRPDAFAGCAVETIAVPLASPWHQATWDHLRLPGLVAAHGVALYHGTKNVLPWRLRIPAVVTVHDLAVYACPETFSAAQRAHLRLLVPRAVRQARRVIAVSAHARADLLQRFGLPGERVVAVPNGVGALYRRPPAVETVEALRAAHGLGPRIVVCAGTLQPRKHVDRVIDAFRRCGGAAAGWQLAIAGRLRPGWSPPWLRDLPLGVRWLGPLPDGALRALYAAAEIAVSASAYEGFGLTVAEAMASGCAIVAVGTTAVPEVVGDAGVLVARSDAALLADALAALLADGERRAALGAAARARAAGFTWEAAAAGTRAVYEQAVGG
jgi:glycosyltransferase involved in cell wall biosynthesis